MGMYVPVHCEYLEGQKRESGPWSCGGSEIPSRGLGTKLGSTARASSGALNCRDISSPEDYHRLGLVMARAHPGNTGSFSEEPLSHSSSRTLPSIPGLLKVISGHFS